MTPEKHKARESGRTRRRILSAALRIFARQGYARVSMRRIAARIGCSPTAIYRHFRNKEELLQAIAASTYAELTSCFEQSKAAAGRDPLATLRSLLTEYIRFCLENPDMFRLFSDIASFEQEDGVMYERLGRTRHPVYHSWLGCIRRLPLAGKADAGEQAVFLFVWDAVDGHIGQRIRHPGVKRKPPAEATAEFLDLLFHGILRKHDHRTGGLS